MSQKEAPGKPDAAERPSKDAAPGQPVVNINEEQFAQDVSVMLGAGLTLLDALKTLRERTDERQGKLLDKLIRRLREGDTLSSGMQFCGGFKPALLASVRSSELTGDLPDALQRYAQNAARVRVMKSKMTSALVYPIMLISVATLVVLFLLLFVVPRFANILEGTGHDMPFMSRVLINIGKTLGGVPNEAWMAIGALLVYGAWRLQVAAKERRLDALVASMAMRIPVIADLLRIFALGQLARSSSMLVRSGVPVIKAMGMCRELLLGPDRLGLDRALAAASAGAPLAASLHDNKLVDSLGMRVLRVAEQTGQLHTALDRLADIHDQDLDRALERAGRLIEPVLMLGIGLVVGGIVVLMYLPIFQLAASVG